MPTGSNNKATEATTSGLREYMGNVYNYLALGLAVTALISYFVVRFVPITTFLTITSRGMSYNLLGNLLSWAPFIYLLFFSAKGLPASLKGTQLAYFGFSALMGVSAALSFYFYRSIDIVRVFLITAGTFGGLSLYAHVTKKDLSAWRTFLYMGLLGLILTSLVNAFLVGSTAMGFVTTLVGVVVFAGYTAYDTQNIKKMYYALPRYAHPQFAVYGAFRLYLDFIYLFLYLLRLLRGKSE